MVAIALDRFREIVKQQKLMTKNVVYIISGIWIWSVMVSAPQLYEYSIYERYEHGQNVTSCGSHDIVEHFETIYAIVIIVISYTLPLILITVSYAGILAYIWKTVDGRVSEHLQIKMKIVRVVVIITVVFILLWSPYFVMFGMEVSYIWPV